MKKNLNYYTSLHLYSALTLVAFIVISAVFSFPVFTLLFLFIIPLFVISVLFFILKKSPLILLVFFSITLLLIFVAFKLYIFDADYKNAVNSFGSIKESVGIIESFPVLKNSKEELKVKIIAVRNNEEKNFSEIKPFFIILTVKSENDFFLEKGDAVIISKKISLPQERIFSFGYRKYLFQNGISGIVRAKENDIKIINDKVSAGFEAAVFKNTLWKERKELIAFLREKLSKNTFAFILSVYLGIRSEMDKELYAEFTNTGLLHLLAISGLNISFLGIVFFRILKTVFSKSISLAASTVILLIYVLVIYPSASSTRAFIMAMIPVIYFYTGMRTAGITVLSVTALIMILINPYDIFDIGFQLSFYATAGILLFSKLFLSILPERMPGWIRENASVTIAAFLSVLFIQWPIFRQASFFSLLSSLIMVPVFNLYFGLNFFMLLLFYVTDFSFFSMLIEISTNGFLSLITILNLIPAQKLPEMPLFIGYIFLPLFFILLYFVHIIITSKMTRLNLNLFSSIFFSKNIIRLSGKSRLLKGKIECQ